MSATLSPSPKQQFFDANGAPLVGGKLYSYTAGTTSPLATYVDSAGTTTNTNPIILDSRGEANVWLGANTYKLALYSATDVLIWTVDDITGAATDTLAVLAASGGSALIGYLPSGTGAVATTVQTKLRETVSVKDFGAVGDGVTDDKAALQSAIDYCITNQKKLIIPVGTYSISAPLIIGKWSGTAWSYAALDIEGEKFTYAAQQVNLSSANIVPTFVNTFAIGIQNGRAVKISNLFILGKNDTSATITSGANMMTNSNWVINSCRDSRYSPYAGIVVDPFGTSIPADGGYPGLSSYYVGSAAGSSTLQFDGVTIQGFVAGVALSPNGSIANCSEISFFDCFIAYNKVGLSMGQSQSRNVNWHSGSCAFNLYCFDGNTYGNQQGYAPAIYGCNMAGKYLFNVTSRYGNVAPITGVHAESFFSIGFNGSNQTAARYPLNFVGCEFNFFDAGVGSNPDYYLLTYSDVNFVGCMFNNQANTYSAVLRFAYQYNSKITFNECFFGTAVQSEFFLAPAVMGASFNTWQDVYFRDSSYTDNSSRGNSQGVSPISNDITTLASNYVERAVFPIGAKIKYIATGGAGDLQLVGGLESDYQIVLGAIAVTTGANGSATFNVADGAIIRTGDLIYTRTAFNTEGPAGTVTLSAAWLCLGIVTNVATNTVTISGCPQNFSSGTYTLSSQWWPKFHSGSTGDTSTSVTIANVTNASAWAIGNKIMGSGIPTGTYITNIVGSTITLSKATTSTVVGARLYDANIYKLTGTAV